MVSKYNDYACKTFCFIWSLSPNANASNANNVGNVNNDGNVNNNNANNNNAVRPAVYLLPDVKVTEGNGSESKPFKFAY